MAKYKVGDSFYEVPENFEITIIRIEESPDQGFDGCMYYFDAPLGGYCFSEFVLYCTLKDKTLLYLGQKNSCNHTFILYESFTDIFEYCTLCNKKRR